jgi:CheY-like chemotaxis protein
MQISNRVGVLLADDSRILRKAVTCLLELEPTITIVAEAENFSQTVAMADALKPDIVLLDLRMPDQDAFASEFVKSKLLVCGSLVLGMSFCGSEYEGDVRALAERFGAMALLDKASFGDELIPAILRLGTSPSSPRALLQQEVHSHDLTTFIDEPPSVARGGQDVVVPAPLGPPQAIEYNRSVLRPSVESCSAYNLSATQSLVPALASLSSGRNY